MRYFNAPVSDTQRQPLEPANIMSGALPGATEIRIGGNQNIKISGKDQQITLTGNDGSVVGIGAIPGNPGQNGFFSLDANGNLVLKIILGTFYIYDGTLDRMQAGVLPDGSINVAISKEGDSVANAFS